MCNQRGIILKDETRITVEANQYGGRLKYWGKSATSGFWDDLWSSTAASVDYSRSLNGHLPRQLRRTFLRWVAPGARVLEAGCGYAQFTVAINALGFAGEGVDYAPRVIHYIQTRFPEIRFFVGDVRSLSNIADGSYDAVYSPGVCEHFEEGPEEVLLEAVRILVPGGLLLVSTPCFNEFRRLCARLRIFRGASNGDFFQYAFGREEMSSILQGLGLTVEQIQGSGSLKTLRDHVPVFRKIPLGPLANPISGCLDSIPGLQRWLAHSCIWVARKNSLPF